MGRHHHHKSNAQVEGDPDTGHSRGLPLRPDEDRLEELLRAERERLGLTAERDAQAD